MRIVIVVIMQREEQSSIHLHLPRSFIYTSPVTSAKVIKTVQVDQYANLQDQAPKREQRYTVTPDPVTADSDDDFGFNETVSFFQDAKDRDLTTGTDKTSTND